MENIFRQNRTELQKNYEEKGKQEFQVERLAFFTDAVFAIAITLIIIEFKVPHITNESTVESVLKDIMALKNQFFSLLLSFYFISFYWMQHHLLFKYIYDYNYHLIVANMIVLLPMIFLPFSTSFVGECSEHLSVVIIANRIFYLNIFISGIAIYYLYWVAFVKYKNIAYEMDFFENSNFLTKTLFQSLVCLLVFLLTFIFPNNFKDLNAVLVIALSLRIFFNRIGIKN